MGTHQTTVKDEKSIKMGSAAILLSNDYGSSFVNFGVAKTLEIVENITPLAVQVDNAAIPKKLKGVAAQSATLTAILLESKATNIVMARGGIDEITTTASSPVTGATQVIAAGNWSFDNIIQIEGRNASGAMPTINSVTGSVDGVLVDRTDYAITKNSVSDWFLTVTDSATVTTENQSITINYDYTPAVTTKTTTGGGVIMDEVWTRYINRVLDTADAVDAAANAGISEGDAIYRTTRYDYYLGTVNVGEKTTFTDSKATDPVIGYPLSIMHERDTTRAPKDQLSSKVEYIELASSVTL